MGAAYHVQGHADRLRRRRAERTRGSRGARHRTVERDVGDRTHHFRQRAAGDKGRQDHHRADPEGPRHARHGRDQTDRHRLHGLRGFPRGPPRLHGKAQTAVSRTVTIIMHKPVDASGNAPLPTQAARLPLSRFKVIDLTLARAGPSCVRTLADWGADVIRVEPPPGAGETDELLGKRDGSDFQNLHRNKRAITLNLKTDEGREIVMRLAERADVVVENMRPGVTKRLGVDFESVKRRNPRIVYGSISGFGNYGPYAERPSIDQIAQGMSGIMSVTGIPGQGPLRVGVAVTDIVAGEVLAQGILIALLDREVSGEGRWVQTSLIEAGLTLLDFRATGWTMDKKVPPQEGNFHPTNTPMGLYPTADGFLNLAATSNKNFQTFCKLIDREKMASDPRFISPGSRGRNREALNELIANALRAKTSREWVEMME